METVTLIITSKIITYLGINLPKESRDSENYRSKMTQTDGKSCYTLGLKEENIVKMSILYKAIYIFNAILIKLHFSENYNRNLKNLYGNTINPEYSKQKWGWRNQTS